MQRSSAAAKAAISFVALGLAACSYSFKAGSGSEAGKPTTSSGDAPSRKPISKPVDGSDPAPPSEPTEDADPHRTPPADEPPPVVEPTLTAVCRVEDESLAALCHRVFDPIAADDLAAWSRQLGEGVVVTRPAYRKGMQRLQGPQAVRDAAEAAGGVRALLHLRPTDRLVGTLANDCRQCRRALVSFEVNTRSGTVAVSVDMTQPPVISSVDVGSHARRRHLEAARQPPARKPEPGATVVTPKSEVAPTPPSSEPTAKPARKKPALLEVPPKKSAEKSAEKTAEKTE